MRYMNRPRIFNDYILYCVTGRNIDISPTLLVPAIRLDVVVSHLLRVAQLLIFAITIQACLSSI